MIRKFESGFTLVELLIAVVIIITITGSIMYGVITTDNSLRNVELRQHAFSSLASKMEEFKAQVALNRIQSSSDNDRRICIEFESIKAMINNGSALGAGCQTIGYLSHNIKKRKTGSGHAKIFDIEASLKFKVVSRFGRAGRDTTIKLNVSQLVID